MAPPLAEERQDQAAGDDRCDLARDVDADGVHQQEVLRILLEPHLVHDAAGHGESGDARRADHGVDLLLEEEVEELGEQHAARGIHHKGDQAKAQDEQRVKGEELGGLHAQRDGDAKENGHEVGQHLLRGIGQGVEHAALADEVAEHQEAHQRRCRRREHRGDDGDDDGEEDARGLGDGLGLVGHADEPLLAGGQQLDDGRLDDGHQRHVGVGRDHDGAQILRAQRLRHHDGGGAVRRADDGDGGRVLEVKEHGGHAQREEDAKLRRRAKQHQLGVGQQRAKVDHRADADEQDQREELVGDAGVEQRGQRALGADQVGVGNVDQDRAKADGQQQRWLHVLFDGQVDQQRADGPHDGDAPVQQVRKIAEQQ